MIWFAVRKLPGFVVAFLVAALAIYAGLDLLPGASAEALPFWQRFLAWLGGMATGNLGVSATLGEPVGALIAGRLAVTLPLAFLALILALLIGLPAGYVAARRQGSILDKALMALARLGMAVPDFWLGMVLVLGFALTLRWLPPGGFIPWLDNPVGALASLLLPALALALPQAAILARAMRLALGDAQGSGFVRAARARGLTTSQAVWQHGLRNALLPVVALLGLQGALLITGTVIVENVFYLPGLGRLILDALAARDLALLRGAVAVLVLVIAGGMFLLGLLRGWADPRLVAREAA